MSAEERDLSILRHIVDYCDQISMAVNHFGNDYTVFPVIRSTGIRYLSVFYR